ncbi:transposase, MuDR, MULE transposase domain protein [Tanacetum coccineum]
MYNDSNIQPVDYDEPQNSNYVAKENALCEFDAIRPDDYHEPDNSYIMDKEDVLGEFDAIKATISIIDKRKGEVSRAFLEKQLDLVKDRISVLKHALKQRYQNTSEDSVKQACNKSDSGVSDVFHQELVSEKHQFTGEGSGYIYEESQGKYSVSQLLQLASNEKSGTEFDCTQLEVDNPIDWLLPNLYEPFSQSQICGYVGYDDMLAPGDMMVNEENIPETKLDDELCLVDLIYMLVSSYGNEVFQDQVDMTAIEENIPDKKFPETVDAGQLVDFATVQSSPLPNGIGDQNPHPTDMVEYLEPHPTPKQTSLIDNVELPTVEHPAYFLLSTVLGKKIVSFQLNCVNMELPRSSVKKFKRLKKVTKKGKFRQAPYTPSPRKDRYKTSVENPEKIQYRQPGADWAISSLYFFAYVMRADVPFWPANGIKYPVPWTEVDRVFIPINEPDTHYCLVVLHIMSGVITLYDSLGVPPIKKIDWWKKMRLVFQSVIPTYLDECGVLKAKCLSLETYKVKFEVPENDPIQGKPTGDCGVWVCYFLYRLCQNLSISTDHDPTHVGLAYRKHMLDYLWKYRITEQRFKSIDNLATLVYQSSKRLVLLPKEIQYLELLRYVCQKFEFNDNSVISLYYKMGSETFEVNDDDDLQFFVNELCSLNDVVQKLIIKLKCQASKVNPVPAPVPPPLPTPLDFDLNVSLLPVEPDLQINLLPKWQRLTFDNMPTPPPPPEPNIKIPQGNSHSITLTNEFIDKQDCMIFIGKKSLQECFEYKVIKSCPISYEDSFSQFPYYCHNLKFSNEGTVTHIETDEQGRFKMLFVGFGTNLLAIGMDGNNQILPIAMGVTQGETGASWTWFMNRLKECIGEVPNLCIISDRHPAIILACKTVFSNSFHGYCDRHLMMNCKFKGKKIRGIPDGVQKLEIAGFDKWSRAYCPTNRFNYMISNSVESVNSLSSKVTNVPKWLELGPHDQLICPHELTRTFVTGKEFHVGFGTIAVVDRGLNSQLILSETPLAKVRCSVTRINVSPSPLTSDIHLSTRGRRVL